jgi:hypothetical protein
MGYNSAFKGLNIMGLWLGLAPKALFDISANT